VIPVKLGNKRKQTHFTGAGGQPVELYVKPGQKVIHCNVFYLGVVEVNLMNIGARGLSTPMWIMTSLEPK